MFVVPVVVNAMLENIMETGDSEQGQCRLRTRDDYRALNGAAGFCVLDRSSSSLKFSDFSLWNVSESSRWSNMALFQLPYLLCLSTISVGQRVLTYVHVSFVGKHGQAPSVTCHSEVNLNF